MKISQDLSIERKEPYKAHRDFMLMCLEENQEEFKRLLFLAAKEDPKFFLKLYSDISKAIMPKQQDVNVSLTLNQDFQALQALAATGMDNDGLLEYENLGPNAIESLPVSKLDTPIIIEDGE